MVSIFVRTLIIYILLSLCLKFMGKRQIGELEVSELVCTLLISEIASIPIADPDIPLANAIIPVFLIVSIEVILSFIKNKSEGLKRRIEGESIFVIYKGKLIQSALSDNRISINEILCEMRNQGIGDICDIYYAILEQNGKLSFIKRGADEKISHSLIVDREINYKTLAMLGYDESRLFDILKKKKIRKMYKNPLDNVFDVWYNL